MRRAAILALLCILGAAPRAQAWVSPVPDIVVYCTQGLLPATKVLAARYSALHDVPVRVFATSASGLVGLLTVRARDDVVIADAATLDILASRKLITPAPRAALGLNRFVLVGKAGTTGPGQTLAMLARGHTIVLTDPTTAASFDGAAILQAVQAPPGRRIGAPDTPDVIFTVLHADNAIGLVQASEVQQRADLRVVALLPTPPLRIEAALVTNGQSGHAADFLGFIATPPAQALLRAQALDPAR